MLFLKCVVYLCLIGAAGFLVSNQIITSLSDVLAAEKQRRMAKAAARDYRIV